MPPRGYGREIITINFVLTDTSKWYCPYRYVKMIFSLRTHQNIISLQTHQISYVTPEYYVVTNTSKVFCPHRPSLTQDTYVIRL